MDKIQEKLYQMEQESPSLGLVDRGKPLGVLKRVLRRVEKIPQNSQRYVQSMEETLYDKQDTFGRFADTIERLNSLPEDSQGSVIQDWFGRRDVTPKEAVDIVTNLNAGCPRTGSRYSVFRMEDGRELHRAIFRWSAFLLGVTYQAEFIMPSGTFINDN